MANNNLYVAKKSAPMEGNSSQGAVIDPRAINDPSGSQSTSVATAEQRLREMERKDQKRKEQNKKDSKTKRLKEKAEFEAIVAERDRLKVEVENLKAQVKSQDMFANAVVEYHREHGLSGLVLTKGPIRKWMEKRAERDNN